jgi:glucose-1-phosphate thymidylyltransferase
MKAILLAGGSGTRIWPLSSAVNKHLLPVYDKPMIYYPLTTLMLAGANDILVVSNPDSLGPIKKLLGDGSQWGIQIRYASQEKPMGIPQAFHLAPDDFLNESVALMLGDNLLYGVGLGEALKQELNSKGARIFGYQVSNPEDYGNIEIDESGKPVQIWEKPVKYRSNLAIPGLYFFDSSVFARSMSISPSMRGELEIVDVLRSYLDESILEVRVLERGTAWLDTGSAQSLLAAGEFVKVIEERQGLKIGCPEEVSLRLGLVSQEDYEGNLNKIPNGSYKNYLQSLIL